MSMPERALHVLAVVPYFVPHIGGGETHLYQLAGLLEGLGCSVTVLTQGLPGSPAFERWGRIEVRRFGRIDSPEGKRAAYAGILADLRSLECNNTVVYVYLSVGRDYCTDMICQTLALARSKGLPRLVRIPSSRRVVELQELYPEGVEELRRADAVIALNPGIHAELVAFGVDHRKIYDIPNGVNTGVFRPAAGVRSGEPRDVVLLSPSRFVQKKRLDELVDLWRRVAERGRTRPGGQLWLVGDPGLQSEHASLSERIHRLVDQLALPGLKIFGSAPHLEMSRYYQMADGYISLSVQEGMSNALLEAMACALPVISPVTESVVPLIRDGWNGFLFEPGDPAAEEEAVERFFATAPEVRRKMGLRSRRVVCRHHRIEHMAGRFEALFRELALAACEVQPCSLC